MRSDRLIYILHFHAHTFCSVFHRVTLYSLQYTVPIRSQKTPSHEIEARIAVYFGIYLFSCTNIGLSCRHRT